MRSKVLYFSLKALTSAAFTAYVEQNRFCYRDSFSLIQAKKKINHSSDIFEVLESIEDLSRLYVIIDFVSFCGVNEQNDESGKRKFDYYQEAAKNFRRAIIKYPEVNFLFDESGLKQTGVSFTNFLFPPLSNVPEDKMEQLIKKIFKPYHRFDIFSEEDSSPFSAVINGRDNLFDGSNLRYVVKCYLYYDLKCSRFNFSVIQETRCKKLAFCVEEELSQNRFNSYALFANGFRVLPVTSALELINLNNNSAKNGDNVLAPDVIIRDYDLQFPDAPDNKYEIIRKSGGTEVKININEVDKIRALKYLDKQSGAPSEVIDRWLVLRDEELKPYWNNIKARKAKVYFISKGDSNMDIRPDIDMQESLEDLSEKLHVKGIYKPVTGLFFPMWNFDFVRENALHVLEPEFNTTRQEYIKKYGEKDPDPQDGVNVKEQQVYRIITKRENHQHGVPLDIYTLVKDMVSRAEETYNKQKFVRAAVIASEAIEVMNGFHEDLMLKAYHTRAISENAIAMNVLGGEESRLERDTAIRTQIIKNTVHRLLFAREIKQERINLAYNVLNQIFSDCRISCKEKEHFKSEEVFIHEMALLNEGYTPNDILIEIREFLRSVFKSSSHEAN